MAFEFRQEFTVGNGKRRVRELNLTWWCRIWKAESLEGEVAKAWECSGTSCSRKALLWGRWAAEFDKGRLKDRTGWMKFD